jgi:hypothetical protein
MALRRAAARARDAAEGARSRARRPEARLPLVKSCCGVKRWPGAHTTTVLLHASHQNCISCAARCVRPRGRAYPDAGCCRPPSLLVFHHGQCVTVCAAVTEAPGPGGLRGHARRGRAGRALTSPARAGGLANGQIGRHAALQTIQLPGPDSEPRPADTQDRGRPTAPACRVR